MSDMNLFKSHLQRSTMKSVLGVVLLGIGSLFNAVALAVSRWIAPPIDAICETFQCPSDHNDLGYEPISLKTIRVLAALGLMLNVISVLTALTLLLSDLVPVSQRKLLTRVVLVSAILAGFLFLGPLVISAIVNSFNIISILYSFNSVSTMAFCFVVAMVINTTGAILFALCIKDSGQLDLLEAIADLTQPPRSSAEAIRNENLITQSID